MSPAIRHAYGFTFIGIAAVLYLWYVLRVRSLQQQISERFPEFKHKRTIWHSWGSNLPGDPAIRRYARMTRVIEFASTACFLAGFALAETSWGFF